MKGNKEQRSPESSLTERRCLKKLYLSFHKEENIPLQEDQQYISTMGLTVLQCFLDRGYSEHKSSSLFSNPSSTLLQNPFQSTASLTGLFSCTQSCPTLYDPLGLYVAHQAPLSMGFCRQEYWSRLPFPSPGVLPDPGIEPASLVSPILPGRFFTISATWEAPL